jgi:VCBS repeat-containing protein
LVLAGTGVLANDFDLDDTLLTSTLVSGPSHGHLTLNPGGSFTYVPALNYNGVESFVYRTSDARGATDEATVTITVRPVNDPPTVVNDTAQTWRTTAVNIRVLGNDFDVDGDPIRVVGASQPANGRVVVNRDNTITFRAKPGYIGTTWFGYVIHDGRAYSTIAYVAVQVIP